MDAWYDEHVVGPTVELLSALPVGSNIGDSDRCGALAIGIEGLFRQEVRFQYHAWPRESTTDGTRLDLCIRIAEDMLDVAGVTWIDFDGTVFPSRAQLERLPADGVVRVTGYIGLVDEHTGAPPRMPPGTLVVAAEDEDGGGVQPELIVGRRQVPIAWTKAFEFPMGNP